MSEQGETIEAAAEAAELSKSEGRDSPKRVPDDIGDVLAISVKEPEEAEHEAECHILQQARNEDAEEEKNENRAEKGESDASDVEKSDDKHSEDWIFVLGHELLKKRILKPGKDVTSRPMNGQMVTVRYSGTLYHQPETVVDNSDRLTFTLGDGDVIMAFDLCVALMELGEIAEVVTDPKYAYGPSGKEPSIPANATLHYELELLSVEDAPKITELSALERASRANQKRERGNGLYAKGEYSQAISSYTKALQFVDSQYDVNVAGDDEMRLLQEMRIKCYNNLAAAQLKLEAWDAAIKSTNHVLRVQPQNVKALFRKGKCLAGKGEISDAIEVLREALALEPETKIIHQELSRLVNKQKKQEESQRKMYQRMIGADKEQEKQAKKSKNPLAMNSMLTLTAVVTGLVAVGLGMYRYLAHSTQ